MIKIKFEVKDMQEEFWYYVHIQRLYTKSKCLFYTFNCSLCHGIAGPNGQKLLHEENRAL